MYARPKMRVQIALRQIFQSIVSLANALLRNNAHKAHKILTAVAQVSVETMILAHCATPVNARVAVLVKARELV